MKKYVWFLLSLSAVWYLAQGFLGPIWAIFVKDIGGGLFAAGSTSAVYGILVGLLTIYISKKSDNLNKKRLLLYGHTLAAIGISGYLLVSSIWHLVIVQVILAVASAIVRPAWKSAYTTVVKGKHSASGWGLWEGLTDMSYGIASLIGGAVAAFFGFQTLFIVMTSAAVLNIILTCILIKRRKGAKLFG